MSTHSLRSRVQPLALALLSTLLLALPAMAEDWPIYKHDSRRTAITEETVELPLHAAWEYRAAQAPSHAWPEPKKLLNRLDFDYAAQLVVADGLVVFGSSADDTVRALDATTGAERWHYVTGGPIRLAPQIYEGKVYFGSDDGWVYCLDAATGKPVWTFKAAPGDEMVLGNERLISRWPCRSGVLVADGVAYTTAGMWPADGVFIYALDAATGETIWVNDTSGHIADVRSLHTNQDFAPYGVSPQGALVLSGDHLLVPNGKAMPAVFSAKTGTLTHFQMGPTFNQSGGSWVTIDGDAFYTMPMIRYFNLATGERIGAIRPRDVEPVAVKAPGKAFYEYDGGRISAVIREGKATMRLAFDLVQAGEVLVEGLDGEVTVVRPDEPEPLWRAPVRGEARCVVVANGRIFVSTTTGSIYSFASGAAGQTVIHDPAAPLRAAAPAGQNAFQVDTIELGDDDLGWTMPANEVGYALVLGDAESPQLVAAASRYHVIVVAPDVAAARALRADLLATTTLYGSRIHVVTANADGRLPMADFFANQILVGKSLAGVSAAELYRVLRPCGGQLMAVGLTADVQARMAAASTAAGDVTKATAKGLLITRGALPGARDWDQPGGVDERVKWPLKLIWYGGPGPADVLDRKQGNVIGPFAYGRYFIRNESHLTGVDAYNGSILWTRPIPKYLTEIILADSVHKASDMVDVNMRRFNFTFTADDKYLYVKELGHLTDGEWSGFLLDPRTGEQLQMYGPWRPPQTQVDLQQARSWEVPVDATHAGQVTVAKVGADVVFTLKTTDPAVTPDDRWELFLDFRPTAQRYGLYDEGALAVNVYPATADEPAHWTPGNQASADMPIGIAGSHDASGATVTVTLPRALLTQLAGGQAVASFDFGARLSSFDRDGTAVVERRYLFSQLVSDTMNDGWARVYVDAPVSEPVAPTVLVGSIDDMPTPPHLHRALRLAPADSLLREPRLHPMTGERGPKFYQTGSFGCGGETFSASLAITRSTGIGIYDFADDSGMRVFDGVKPSCRGSVVAALGLLLSSEGRGGCECTTNFQASLALAPTDRRSNEDWALFYDLAPFGPLREVVVNMGAPGDRRDDDGDLWLGYPRVQSPVGKPMLPPGVLVFGLGTDDVPAVLQVPMAVTLMDGGGPERTNADRVQISDTDRPWIYASRYRGITQATIELGHPEQILSASAPVPPTLDGRLEADEWPPEPVAVLTKSQTRIYVAHDADNLYLAGVYPSIIDRLGKPLKWNVRKDAKPDTYIDRDEAWEVFISDARQETVVRMTVLVGGSHYDSRWTPGTEPDVSWNGEWQTAVTVSDEAFTAEMTVPWQTLKDAGLDPATVRINLMSSGPYRWSDALRVITDRERCDRFITLARSAAPTAPTREFRVRLHFAEFDDSVQPGQRVFSVKIQGKTVLENLDIAAAVGTRKALVHSFPHIKAGTSLAIEFVPQDPAAGAAFGPVISGIEVVDESYTTVAEATP